MGQRSDRGVTIEGSSGVGKDKEKEKDKALGASTRKPNKDKRVTSKRTREEDGSIFWTSKKHRVSSSEVQILEKGSVPVPRTLTVPADTSFFNEPKVALESLSGLVLVEDKKYLLDKC